MKTKLTPTIITREDSPGEGMDYCSGFGQGIAISENTAILAATWDGNSEGSPTGKTVYFYVKDENGTWNYIKKLKTGAFAISGDTAIKTDGEAQEVQIFSRNQDGPDKWGQIQQTLPQNGKRVAIEDDTIVVATDSKLYIYSRDGQGKWNHVTDSDIPKTSGSQGMVDVVLSGDTIAVAEKINMNGIISVFERNQGSPNNWGFVKRLKAEDSWYLKDSVAIDGDLIVTGGSKDGDKQGYNTEFDNAALLFERNQGSPNNWGQVKPIRLMKDKMHYGSAVAISGDIVVVGHESHGNETSVPWQSDYKGAAYVYKRDEGGPENWGLIQKLEPTDLDKDAKFGSTVAINKDTNSVVVGAPGKKVDQDGAGTVYFYEAPPLSAWSGAYDVSGLEEYLGDIVKISDTFINFSRSDGNIRKSEFIDHENDDSWKYDPILSTLTIGRHRIKTKKGLKKAECTFSFSKGEGGENTISGTITFDEGDSNDDTIVRFSGKQVVSWYSGNIHVPSKFGTIKRITVNNRTGFLYVVTDDEKILEYNNQDALSGNKEPDEVASGTSLAFLNTAQIYILDSQGNIKVGERKDGQYSWTQIGSGANRITASYNRKLYAIFENKTIQKYRGTSMTWEKIHKSNISPKEIVVSDDSSTDIVYAQTKDNEVYKVSLDSVDRIASNSSGGDMIAPYADIVCLLRKGNAYKGHFDKDGKHQWKQIGGDKKMIATNHRNEIYAISEDNMIEKYMDDNKWHKFNQNRVKKIFSDIGTSLFAVLESDEQRIEYHAILEWHFTDHVFFAWAKARA